MSLLFFMPDSIGRNTKKDYIRIEQEAGGTAHLAMSECNSDAIDKVADARANVRTQRADNDAVIRLHRESLTIPR